MDSVSAFQSIFDACAGAYPSMPPALFKEVWDCALRTHRIVVGKELSQDVSRQINDALRNTVVYHGAGCTYMSATTTKAAHTAQFLLGGESDFSALNLSWEHFKALTFESNPQLLQEIRAELRHCLSQITYPEDNQINTRAFVTNVLSLLPFTYPEVGSPMTIPRPGAEHASYMVSEIVHLTPSWLCSPLPAYILRSPGQPTLLIFLGTTFPAGQGFSEGFRADCTPGMSVGHIPMLFGIDKLREALKNDTNIEVTGASLGAATGLQFLRLLSEEELGKFSRFDLVRPPGLYWWNWTKEFNQGPEVNIYIQPNDAVSHVGIFPTGSQVSLYKSLNKDGLPENMLKAHARGYNGGDLATVLKLDPKIENSRPGRIARTLLHIVLGPLLYCVMFVATLVHKLFELLFKLLSTLFP